MKLKSKLVLLASLALSCVSLNAATFVVSNIQGGPGTDTLFANENGSLMNGGVVSIGYFAVGVSDSQLDTVVKLTSMLSGFTGLQSSIPGAYDLGVPSAGYANDDNPYDSGAITGTNALLGRQIYAIATSAASLAAATLAPESYEYALFKVDTIKSDDPVANSYVANPAGSQVLIGTTGTYVGDAGLGDGTYATLKMTSVPEPSAALLGAIGALGLLRRRRN